MQFRIFLVLFIASSCWAQSIAVGLKGGVRATDDFTGTIDQQSRRYVLGPTVDIGLPFGLGFEADALYRRIGYETVFSNFAGSSDTRVRGSSWEFPLLVKVRLPFPLVSPYASGGYAARRISGSATSFGTTVDIPTGNRTSATTRFDTPAQTSHGLVIGAGVRLGLGPLRLSPELRYTRWNNQAISFNGIQGFRYQSTQNQIDALVGITWKVR
jgi:hypothetical protein